MEKQEHGEHGEKSLSGQVTLAQVTHDDLDTILRIQDLSHQPEYRESKEVFAGMISAYPSGNMLALCQGKVAGYIFSHPSFIGSIQPLNEGVPAIDGSEDCMYIHDLAIDPQYRGMGISKILLGFVDSLAKSTGFDVVMSVSVSGSRRFLEAQGFTVVKEVIYGGLPAFYMEKQGLKR